MYRAGFAFGQWGKAKTRGDWKTAGMARRLFGSGGVGLTAAAAQCVEQFFKRFFDLFILAIGQKTPPKHGQEDQQQQTNNDNDIHNIPAFLS